MELKTFFAQDLLGNVIPNPTVYVYQPGTTTLATGLENETGGSLTNPFTGNVNGKISVAAPDGDYDIRVTGAGRDSTMRVRFIDSVAGSADILRADLASTAAGNGAELVGFKQAGAGAVDRTAQAKMREAVSVRDFGAVGDGGVDDTAAVQAAVTYAEANDKAVLLNDGEFKITAPISITSQVAILGCGQAVSRLLCVNCNAFTVSAGVGFVTMDGFTIAHASRYTITPNSNTAIKVLGTTAQQCYWHTYRDLFIDGFQVGFQAGGVCSSRWHNVKTTYTHQSVNFVEQCLNNAISQCGFGEQFDSTAGSYGIKVGDGLINCEGLQISDSLIYGVRRGIWVNASINVVGHHNIIDMVREFGVLAQSAMAAGCVNNIFSSNYIGITGSAGDCGIYLANGYASADSQNRGTVLRDNEILAYPGSTLAYGILVDGAEEERNLISGNRVQNTTVYDCRIAAGSGHRVSDNLWRSASGFVTTVAGVSYINNVGNISAAYPSPIGVFTPSAIGTSSAGVGTYTTQTGSYKIVDKLVYFNARITWTAHTGSGDLRISGLPAPSKNVAGYAPAVIVNVEGLTFPAGASSIIGLINTGASTIELRGAGNALAPTPVAMDTAASINISGFYEID